MVAGLTEISDLDKYNFKNDWSKKYRSKTEEEEKRLFPVVWQKPFIFSGSCWYPPSWSTAVTGNVLNNAEWWWCQLDMSGRGLPMGGWARSRYELGEIWSSGWGSSMVWEELLSSKGTWHSLIVGGTEWRGADGGEGAGGRRLEEAVEGGRGRPEEWTDKRRRQTCYDHVTWRRADINILAW